MKRSGLFSTIVCTLSLFLIIAQGISAESNNIDNFLDNPNNGLLVALVTTPPVFTDTFDICAGDYIYDTIAVYMENVDDADVSIELVDGTGSLNWQKVSPDSLYGYYSMLPVNDGEFTVTYLVTDSNGDSLYYNYLYVVNFNQSPTIENQYYYDYLCDLNEIRFLPVDASDPEGDGLTFSLLSKYGTINANSGIIKYTPDTSGIFVFQVEVNDGCSADTAFVYDTLVLNTPPQVYCYDSTVKLCEVQEICFNVYGHDGDDEPFEIRMLEGLGSFEMTTDSSGRACFMPADVDTAVYQFVFRALDSCQLAKNDMGPTGVECCFDTTWITVIINQPPTISCPEVQTFFSCEGGEFCFDIEASDYENYPLTYNVLSDNASFEDGTVCVTAEESVQLEVVLEVVDKCGASDTCTVTVMPKRYVLVPMPTMSIIISFLRGRISAGTIKLPIGSVSIPIPPESIR